jgi:CheY-like chemotaxis protein/two-component sensor histidine kinase
MIQLLMDTPLSDEQKKALLVAQDSSRHLLMLLNDILDISRIEAGAMELTPVPVDVRQLWRSLHMNFEPGALAKGLALEMVCDDSVPVCLSMDLTRLRQICINLISNAIKYTPSGWIKVSARFEADEASVQGRLLLEVRDTGIGVPAHMTESIFSPFVQADNSYSRSHAGAGLGLAITRGLVDLMGGSIHVTSDPGAGACFRVSLPCPVLVSPASTPGEGPVSGTPLRQPSRALKVLVAEDHPVNQKVIEQMLRKLGHAPTLAADGQEALEWLQRQKFDLLLLDVMMPRLDGLQVLSLWRHQESATAQRLPIVMVTAHAMTGDAQRFLEAGADGYLAKPLSMDRLAEEIVRQIPAQSR